MIGVEGQPKVNQVALGGGQLALQAVEIDHGRAASHSRTWLIC